MNSPLFISLCIITKNEEHCIARCLDSARKLVDEIIVVDTGSNDNTIKLAAEYGAKIFSFPWIDDFSAARNYGISKAQGHWILVLDADEFLTPLSRAELLAFMESSPAEGYYFRIYSYLDHNSANMEDYVVRLFKNLPEYEFSGAIHEQVVGSIQIHNGKNALVFAPFTIEHDGYLKKEMENKHKFDRNTDLLKKALLVNPQDPFFHYCLGIEYLQHKNFQQAGPLLEKTITLLQGTEGYIPQVLIGLLLVKLLEPEDPHAEELFCKAARALPDNGDIFCLYGVWLIKGKRFLEGTKVLEIAMCKKGELLEHGRLSALLGDAYFLAGMNTLAMKSYIHALCSTPMDLYPLTRLLTLWPSETNSPSLAPLWEKLTPEITNTLLRQTRGENRFTLGLAIVLLAIIERTKANDMESVISNCNTYVQMLRAVTFVTPLCAHVYAILSLAAEELLLQSQLRQLSGDYVCTSQQTIINGAQGNLLLLSSLMQEFSTINPLNFWEEVFIGETCVDCQSNSPKAQYPS